MTYFMNNVLGRLRLDAAVTEMVRLLPSLTSNLSRMPMMPVISAMVFALVEIESGCRWLRVSQGKGIIIEDVMDVMDVMDATDAIAARDVKDQYGRRSRKYAVITVFSSRI